MHHRLFRWEPDRPTFPERADLPHLSDEAALAALRVLRMLVDEGLADTYSQPVRGLDGRLTLEQWAVQQVTRTGGEDAPA